MTAARGLSSLFGRANERTGMTVVLEQRVAELEVELAQARAELAAANEAREDLAGDLMAAKHYIGRLRMLLHDTAASYLADAQHIDHPPVGGVRVTQRALTASQCRAIAHTLADIARDLGLDVDG